MIFFIYIKNFLIIIIKKYYVYIIYMSNSQANDIFITDEVRDYIAALHEARHRGVDVSTKAMTFSLYSGLSLFMDKISQYDTIDKRNTLKNYLVNILCSSDSFYTPELKEQKIDSFIQMIENENKPENNSQILKAMKDIKSKLPTMLNSDTPVNECKEKIVKTLGNYFTTTQLTQTDIDKHEEMKTVLKNADTDDVKLFLDYFNFVQCKTDSCDNSEMSTMETTGSRLNMKKDGEEIILLNLFKGRDTVVVLSAEEEGMIDYVCRIIWENLYYIIGAISLCLLGYAYKTGMIFGSQKTVLIHMKSPDLSKEDVSYPEIKENKVMNRKYRAAYTVPKGTPKWEFDIYTDGDVSNEEQFYIYLEDRTPFDPHTGMSKNRKDREKYFKAYKNFIRNNSKKVLEEVKSKDVDTRYKFTIYKDGSVDSKEDFDKFLEDTTRTEEERKVLKDRNAEFEKKKKEADEKPKTQTGGTVYRVYRNSEKDKDGKPTKIKDYDTDNPGDLEEKYNEKPLFIKDENGKMNINTKSFYKIKDKDGREIIDTQVVVLEKVTGADGKVTYEQPKYDEEKYYLEKYENNQSKKIARDSAFDTNFMKLRTAPAKDVDIITVTSDNYDTEYKFTIYDNGFIDDLVEYYKFKNFVDKSNDKNDRVKFEKISDLHGAYLFNNQNKPISNDVKLKHLSVDMMENKFMNPLFGGLPNAFTSMSFMIFSTVVVTYLFNKLVVIKNLASQIISGGIFSAATLGSLTAVYNFCNDLQNPESQASMINSAISESPFSAVMSWSKFQINTFIELFKEFGSSIIDFFKKGFEYLSKKGIEAYNKVFGKKTEGTEPTKEESKPNSPGGIAATIAGPNRNSEAAIQEITDLKDKNLSPSGTAVNKIVTKIAGADPDISPTTTTTTTTSTGTELTAAQKEEAERLNAIELARLVEVARLAAEEKLAEDKKLEEVAKLAAEEKLKEAARLKAAAVKPAVGVPEKVKKDLEIKKNRIEDLSNGITDLKNNIASTIGKIITSTDDNEKQNFVKDAKKDELNAILSFNNMTKLNNGFPQIPDLNNKVIELVNKSKIKIFEIKNIIDTYRDIAKENSDDIVKEIYKDLETIERLEVEINEKQELINNFKSLKGTKESSNNNKIIIDAQSRLSDKRRTIIRSIDDNVAKIKNILGIVVSVSPRVNPLLSTVGSNIFSSLDSIYARGINTKITNIDRIITKNDESSDDIATKTSNKTELEELKKNYNTILEELKTKPSGDSNEPESIKSKSTLLDVKYNEFAAKFPMTGGAMVDCYKIANLKQNMLSRLVKFDVKDSYEYNKLEQCEMDDYDFNGMAFVLDTSNTVREKQDNCEGPDSISKIIKLEKFAKANLARRNKIRDDSNQVWNNVSRNMKTPNIAVGPGMFEILKGTYLPSGMNYQLGGGDVDETENYNFIKTKNSDVKIQYSYQIITLLKKALQRLNNNGIYLEAKTVKEIQSKIDTLVSAEKALSEYAEDIVTAGKISANRDEKETTMDSQKLHKYVESHKRLSQSADKTAIKLNSVFIKLLELVNDRGDEIVSAVERAIR